VAEHGAQVCGTSCTILINIPVAFVSVTIFVVITLTRIVTEEVRAIIFVLRHFVTPSIGKSGVAVDVVIADA